jgi:hypothetical protein
MKRTIGMLGALAFILVVSVAAWTVPDKGEGDHNHQSIMFQEYLEVLSDGLQGNNFVLSGCALTGGADMTPAIAKGAVMTAGVLKPVTAGDVTIGTADATNPRFDLVVVNSSGTKAVRAGTAAAVPKPPARTANDVVLYVCYVPANDTSIETTKCVDMRVFRNGTPQVISKVTTARTVNTSTAANSIWATAPVIPNGLFLTGKILRVRAGGNFLLNSGTPTLRLEILYGGTTMYSFITAAATADADRRAWHIDFEIAAQANNDQAMAGDFQMTDPLNATATPTTGIGPWTNAAGSEEGGFGISGSAAVDSDAADRTLDVRFTMNVSNAADEMVVEFATVELL